MKRCSRCKQTKPLSSFGVAAKRKDGLQRLCVVCNREQAREAYHAKNKKDEHAERAATRHRTIRNALHVVKEAAGCLVCGEKHPLCLDLHHASGDKEFNLSMTGFGITRVIEEIRKCEVLCANCHRLEHGGVIKIGEPRNLDISPLLEMASKTRKYKKREHTPR